MRARKYFLNAEIQYDTLIDHNAFQYLRISAEVPRTEKDTAYIFLNGSKIGKIILLRNLANKIMGIEAVKNNDEKMSNIDGGSLFKDEGQAMAALVRNSY